MSYTLFKTVDFGSNYSGLTTVGYKIFDYLGNVSTARTTGAIAIGNGAYGSLVTISSGFVGSIYWDTATGSSVYAIESINPQEGEYLNTYVNTAASGNTVNINLAQTLGHTQTANTVGRALQIARAQGRGNWVINTTTNTLVLYDTDGTTVVASFDLTPHGGPYSSRTVTSE